MRLVDWRPLRKGKLYGFATVELTWGLVIYEVPVLDGRDGAWAALPTKPQIDRDGRQRREADGSPAFGRILGWREKRLEDQFSRMVVDLVRKAHPGAFD